MATNTTMSMLSARNDDLSLAGIGDWTGAVVIGSAKKLSCAGAKGVHAHPRLRVQLLPVPVRAKQTVQRSHSFRFHTLARFRWILVFPTSLQSSSRTPLRLPGQQPLQLRQSERYNVVALLGAEFAVTARRNHQILFAFERVGHGRGLSASRKFEFPELFAGLGIEGA
jgi:hypothetical protein